MCLPVPPVVVVSPTRFAIEDRLSAIILGCDSDGDEPLNVTWSKDGNPFNV